MNARPAPRRRTLSKAAGLVAAAAALVVAGTTTTGSGAQAGVTWALSGAGTVYTDVSAPAGTQAHLWSNGTATTQVTGAGQVKVFARADLCEGPATMAVSVDGVQVGKATVKNGTGWTPYVLGGFTAAPGQHSVTVAFTNDHRTTGCDRNLRIGGVTLVPAPAGSTVWSLSSAGSVAADATAPGGIQAQLWSNGAAAAKVSGSGRVTVLARADLCEGSPRMEVSVDGKVAGTSTVVNASGWWPYQVGSLAASAGEHLVSVRFLNDHSTATCDRNLRLGGASFEHALPTLTAPDKTGTTDGESSPSVTAQTNPFLAAAPYADPTYPSVQAAAQLRAAGDTESAALLDRISAHTAAKWVGDWNSTETVAAHVRSYAEAANRAGRTGVVVTYAVPARDCGSHSAGGLTAQTYPAWVRAVADGLRGTRTAVVVEPDALAQLGQCAHPNERTGLLRQAVADLSAAGATVYLDAGHSNWVPASTMAYRLRQAGIDQARGFALNVSNHNTTDAERAYGEKVSAILGGKAFVVDTGRNGNGSNGEWCNSRGRALGVAPGAVTDGTNQDANLWIKRPGQSDGTCNGGPTAGDWWTEIALELAGNAR